VGFLVYMHMIDSLSGKSVYAKTFSDI